LELEKAKEERIEEHKITKFWTKNKSHHDMVLNFMCGNRGRRDDTVPEMPHLGPHTVCKNQKVFLLKLC
jgi:hypothetical protein